METMDFGLNLPKVEVKEQTEQKLKFNKLKMYFGRPFDVGNGMKIYTPYMKDIIDLDDADNEFYQTLYIWIANPTTYRLMLWDMKPRIDWCKISNYELFLMLFKTENKAVSKLLFGDIDFQDFQPYLRSTMEIDKDGQEIEKQTLTLYSQTQDIEIQEKDYNLISAYLKAAFNIYPKVEKAKGMATKEAIIEEDRMNLAYKQNNAKADDNESPLLPMVSFAVNHPGFKYNAQELESVNFVQFMDSVSRLQIFENTRALLQGSMSGFCDMSKVPKDEFNFMRDILSKK